MLSVARGRKPQAWLLGFLQALLFITVVSGLFSSLQSPLNLAAYAAGFASGTVVGMALESRLAPGHSLLGEFIDEHLGQLMNFPITQAFEVGGKKQVDGIPSDRSRKVAL